MGTMFLGKGTPLYLASSDPREPVWESAGVQEATIPSSSSSIGIAVNAGCQLDINVIFGTAPAGTAVNVMYAALPTFTGEYVLSALPAVALQTTYTFTTQNIRLSGFIRITNAGGQDITGAWLQQTV